MRCQVLFAGVGLSLALLGRAQAAPPPSSQPSTQPSSQPSGQPASRPTGPTKASAQERAQATAAALKSQLLEALQASIKSSGAAQSIHVCQSIAPALAASLSVDGVVVGRTSSRLRNAKNAPPAWVNAPLQTYLKQTAAEWKPQTVALPGGRLGYVEPLPMQVKCMACHGEDIHPDVRKAIEKAYPHDAATGFREGDLRGVVWVELPAD